MTVPQGLIAPVRVERDPQQPDRFRLYGEQGSLATDGRTFTTRAAAAIERDRINQEQSS